MTKQKPSEKLKLVEGKKFNLFIHVLGSILDEMAEQIAQLQAQSPSKESK